MIRTIVAVTAMLLAIIACLTISVGQAMAETATDKRLFDSIEEFDSQGVKSALKDGADPNAIGGKGRNNMSPLKVAAMEGLDTRTPGKINAVVEILNILFENGAKLSKRDQNILSYPINSGNIQVARIFLENGASSIRPIRGLSPIALAEVVNQKAIMDLLVEFGAVRLSKSAAAQAKLISAVVSFDLEQIKKALAAGAKVTEPAPGNLYALITIASMGLYHLGSVRTFEFLLSKGADPNVYSFTSENLNGTPLTALVENSFHERSRQNLFRIMEMLIEHGADMGRKDSFGRSLLHIAAEGDDGPLVKKLIDLGADVGALNSKGKTPFEVAKSKPVADLLRQNGLTKKAEFNEENYEKGIEAYQHHKEAEAVELLRPLADIGNDQAQMVLGAIYFDGSSSIQKTIPTLQNGFACLPCREMTSANINWG